MPRLTLSQALVRFLAAQYVSRDGQQHKFFAGIWGIFGHGNLAGIGQALQQISQTDPHALPYYQARNEQAQVHAAIAFAKHKNRLQTFACTSSIGPGATNMLTGAATATINRLPVLLLPGDIFAARQQAPVLQQLESEHSQEVSVNDAFRPLSRYWDRLWRPEQLITALPEAMRVLTSPAETGAVTLCLPQDTQTEAYDYPEAFFAQRLWYIARPRPDQAAIARAAQWIRASSSPLIIAGGGVHYSEATAALRAFAEQFGIPVGESQAGKGALPYDHRLCLGAIGATGTLAANQAAHNADLVIGVGTRYSDFTTASKTAFANPNVRFININVAAFDAYKHNALPLVGDAQISLQDLAEALGGWQTGTDYQRAAAQANLAWDAEVSRLYAMAESDTGLLAQASIIGMVNGFSQPQDVVLCAAGSLPGDLHKLWRTRDPRGYHMEYGYSCMGYEIAGGMGVKMAAPDREIYVLVGDGSFLMMNSEIVTMVQERLKVIIVVLDNHGFASIGNLSKSVGSDGFGTKYRYREGNQLAGEVLPVDYAQNCASLGATVFSANDSESFKAALTAARAHQGGPVCIVTEVDRLLRVGGYESWWDVAVAEVSENAAVQAARAQYEEQRKAQRYFLENTEH
jgi:3D-(3,5/4)-trihydroxycyclohexane-1,2-dione acylhydrolase (decyclizing)